MTEYKTKLRELEQFVNDYATQFIDGSDNVPDYILGFYEGLKKAQSLFRRPQLSHVVVKMFE